MDTMCPKNVMNSNKKLTLRKLHIKWIISTGLEHDPQIFFVLLPDVIFKYPIPVYKNLCLLSHVGQI